MSLSSRPRVRRVEISGTFATFYVGPAGVLVVSEEASIAQAEARKVYEDSGGAIPAIPALLVKGGEREGRVDGLLAFGSEAHVVDYLRGGDLLDPREVDQVAGWLGNRLLPPPSIRPKEKESEKDGEAPSAPLTPQHSDGPSEGCGAFPSGKHQGAFPPGKHQEATPEGAHTQALPPPTPSPSRPSGTPQGGGQGVRHPHGVPLTGQQHGVPLAGQQPAFEIRRERPTTTLEIRGKLPIGSRRKRSFLRPFAQAMGRVGKVLGRVSWRAIFLPELLLVLWATPHAKFGGTILSLLLVLRFWALFGRDPDGWKRFFLFGVGAMEAVPFFVDLGWPVWGFSVYLLLLAVISFGRALWLFLPEGRFPFQKRVSSPFSAYREPLHWHWQRTGDPLGDFVRLIRLLEEALERIGAPKRGTLGDKLNSEPVRNFLRGLPDGAELRAKLFWLLEVRNRVLHDRVQVPPQALEEGPRVLQRLLAHLERRSTSRGGWRLLN